MEVGLHCENWLLIAFPQCFQCEFSVKIQFLPDQYQKCVFLENLNHPTVCFSAVVLKYLCNFNIHICVYINIYIFVRQSVSALKKCGASVLDLCSAAFLVRRK